MNRMALSYQRLRRVHARRSILRIITYYTYYLCVLVFTRLSDLSTHLHRTQPVSTWICATNVELAVCVCWLHIKPFFLPKESSTPTSQSAC